MARETLLSSRKLMRLAAVLGSDALAVGHLEILWQSAYADGEPELGDSIDVEARARWRGAPGDLTRALLQSGGPNRPGFIEPVGGDEETPRYRLHDFWDHAPAYVRRRRRREQDRKMGSRLVSGAPEACHRRAGGNDSAVTGAPVVATPSPSPSPSPKKKEKGTPDGAPSSSGGHRALPEIPEALRSAIPDVQRLLQEWLDVLPSSKVPTIKGRERTVKRLTQYLTTYGAERVHKLINMATDRYWRSMEMEWLESTNGNRRSSPSDEVFAEHERFERERRKSRPALDIPARLRELVSQLPASPVGDSLRSQIEALVGGDLETVQAALERIETEALDSAALDAEQQERVDAAQEMVRQHYQRRISAHALNENLKIMRRQVVRKALALPALSLFA